MTQNEPKFSSAPIYMKFGTRPNEGTLISNLKFIFEFRKFRLQIWNLHVLIELGTLREEIFAGRNFRGI